MSELAKNNFVFPDYNNSNLSIIRDIAAQRRGRTGGKDKKIFLVVDGLGYDLLVENLLPNGEQLYGAKVEQISTIFPSTTTAVLNSLESGRTPAEHGIIGWDVYQKEFGMVVTPYRDSPSFARRTSLIEEGVPSILPRPDLLDAISRRGKIRTVFPEGIVAASEIKNCERTQYYTPIDMFVQLKDAVRKGGESFIYAYYDGIDHLEHRYGYTHESVRLSVISFFDELYEILLPSLQKSDYNLVITADHGHVEAKKKITITSESEIMKYLAMPPWGDSRTLCLSVLPGREDDLRGAFNRSYGADAVLIDSGSLISTGIFGKEEVGEKVRGRFGTHMVLMKEGSMMKYEYPLEAQKRREMEGFHSGLSEREMRIPLIVY